MSAADAILQSIDGALEQRGDITDLVYQTLYARQPHYEALFVLDIDGGRRRHMLAEAIDVLADLVGANTYGANFLFSERTNHAALGVAPDTFAAFFEALHEVVKQSNGAAWTPDMESAWAAAMVKVQA